MRARIAYLSIAITSVLIYSIVAFWPAGVAADQSSQSTSSTTTQTSVPDLVPVTTAPTPTTAAPPPTTVPIVVPTTTPPPPVAAPALSAPDLVAAWTRVAVCEQGGWGNYGFPAYPNSLGINAQSWAQFGGGADLSIDAQIAVAERFRAYYGIAIPDQNGCAAW